MNRKIYYKSICNILTGGASLLEGKDLHAYTEAEMNNAYDEIFEYLLKNGHIYTEYDPDWNDRDELFGSITADIDKSYYGKKDGPDRPNVSKSGAFQNMNVSIKGSSVLISGVILILKDNEEYTYTTVIYKDSNGKIHQVHGYGLGLYPSVIKQLLANLGKSTYVHGLKLSLFIRPIPFKLKLVLEIDHTTTKGMDTKYNYGNWIVKLDDRFSPSMSPIHTPILAKPESKTKQLDCDSLNPNKDDGVIITLPEDGDILSEEQILQDPGFWEKYKENCKKYNLTKFNKDSKSGEIDTTMIFTVIDKISDPDIRKYMKRLIIKIGLAPIALCNTYLNIALLGNAGVGKTRTARLIAQALFYAGLLVSPDPLIFSPQQSAGGLVSSQAQELRSIISSKNIGRLVLIDEGYSLAECDPETGKRAHNQYQLGTLMVTTLMELTDIYKDKIPIIIAGYEHPMKECFFKANEGLPRRFPEIFTIKVEENTLATEFMNLLDSNLKKNRYQLSPNYSDKLTRRLGNMQFRNNFASVEKLLNKIMEALLVQPNPSVKIIDDTITRNVSVSADGRKEIMD